MSVEKEFVPYDRALRMKELGFDEPCLAYYSKYNDSNRPPHLAINFKHSLKSNSDFRHLQTLPLGEGLFIGINEGGCACPFITQAFRWFREKYNKIDYPEFDYEEQKWFCHSNYEFSKIYFNTYDEAELACLEKLIEIVESKSE